MLTQHGTGYQEALKLAVLVCWCQAIMLTQHGTGYQEALKLAVFSITDSMATSWSCVKTTTCIEIDS